MGCGVILADLCSACRVDRKLCHIAYLDHTCGTGSNMSDLTALQLDRIAHGKLAFGGLDHTGITDLSTHCCIERCLVNNYCTIYTFGQRLCQLGLGGEHSDL